MYGSDVFSCLRSDIVNTDKSYIAIAHIKDSSQRPLPGSTTRSTLTKGLIFKFLIFFRPKGTKKIFQRD